MADPTPRAAFCTIHTHPQPTLNYAPYYEQRAAHFPSVCVAQGAVSQECTTPHGRLHAQAILAVEQGVSRDPVRPRRSSPLHSGYNTS
mmetsp:Transcript_4961/g.7962  ORF Transcript_4961/g.7962 Transcript_4961/m.7962 type:complete len:88 (-) Transcript_4961:96-359(-)